jgi:predicted RNase H-like HicB family nuclease
MAEPDMRKFRIHVRKEEEGGYSGQCIELPAAISQGETLEELKENMKDAILLVLEDMMEEAREKEAKENNNNNNIMTLEVLV